MHLAIVQDLNNSQEKATGKVKVKISNHNVNSLGHRAANTGCAMRSAPFPAGKRNEGLDDPGYNVNNHSIHL